jgi:hypothetical protein
MKIFVGGGTIEDNPYGEMCIVVDTKYLHEHHFEKKPSTKDGLKSFFWQILTCSLFFGTLLVVSTIYSKYNFNLKK